MGRTEWLHVVAQTKEVKTGVSGKTFTKSSEHCSKSQTFKHYYPWMRLSISSQSGQVCVGCIQPHRLRTFFVLYFFFYKMLNCRLTTKSLLSLLAALLLPVWIDVVHEAESTKNEKKNKKQATKFKLCFSSLVS